MTRTEGREVVFVVARADNGIIARDGKVPWRIREDLKRFVAHTMGTPMIMGRKTFESFPAPLKDRRHIVLTRNRHWTAPGAEVAYTLEQALALAGPGDVSVIGGAEIFELFMPFATRFELTEVHEDTHGDTAMPYPGEEWVEVAREEREADGKWPAHSFVTLRRNPPSRLRDRALSPPKEGSGWACEPLPDLPTPRPPPASWRGSMTRLSHRDPVPEALRGAVIALGNFDGFHLGHQRVVAEAVEWARAEGRPALVATFDPHPVRHFAPQVPPFRLTSLAQREELFTAAGADAMLVFHFDGALAATSAEDFVGTLLAGHLGAAGVVTGEDFTFGQGKRGNVALLASEGAKHGLAARAVARVLDAGEPVSSSRIRDALASGDCETATRLMTRPFAVRASVAHGDKRGRTIGFPTANLELGPYLRPLYGVYAVTGRVIASGEALQGAANVGVRPMFDPPKELLETYFFDFAGELYGQEIEVVLHHFLRPEARFDTLGALSAQMAADCERAKTILSSLRA